jgi:hypothetical protein
MGEVSSHVPEATLAAVNGNGVPGCTEACLALHQQHQKSLQEYQKSTTPQQTDSPWHYLKTIFLVTTVASLIVWVLVYTVLSQMTVVWRLFLARTVQEPCRNQVQRSSSKLWKYSQQFCPDLQQKTSENEPHKWHLYQLLHLYLVVNYIRILSYLDQVLFIYFLTF